MDLTAMFKKGFEMGATRESSSHEHWTKTSGQVKIRVSEAEKLVQEVS